MSVMDQTCGFLWTRKIQKAFSFTGASPPNFYRELWTARWVLRPQAPVIGSRSTLAMTSEPCQGLALTKAGYAQSL